MNFQLFCILFAIIPNIIFFTCLKIYICFSNFLTKGNNHENQSNSRHPEDRKDR